MPSQQRVRMYVPPYEALLRSFQTDRSSVEKNGNVTLPLTFFKLLLQIALAHSDFEEESYLRANSDVRTAVDRGAVESGRLHYIGYGYFEGRRGAIPFDTEWYLHAYPDVAEAVSKGLTRSAEEHFYVGGGGEGRSPNEAEKNSADEWKRALK
jgi:hypothetical protein